MNQSAIKKSNSSKESQNPDDVLRRMLNMPSNKKNLRKKTSKKSRNKQ